MPTPDLMKPPTLRRTLAAIALVCATLGVTPRVAKAGVPITVCFVSRACLHDVRASGRLDHWAYLSGVRLDFSRPGTPTDNGLIEAFNGRVRAECLNENWFLSLADAVEKIASWRRHDNTERPHSALGSLAPEEFAASSGRASLAG